MHVSDRARHLSEAQYSTANSIVDLEFRSTAYRRAVEQLDRFARASRVPVLIEGECGTGKTQIARRVHLRSPRGGRQFESVVLSTLDDTLAGSELFGHVSGAFTDARSTRMGRFAAANGGSLFLDEIGKASGVVQQKLLHAIEYGEMRAVGSDREVRVDVRILAATNVPLEHLADEGRFLPDLYARLAYFRVRLPPLRERRADIPVLVEHYLNVYASEFGYDRPPAVDDDLMLGLQRAPWPHNLRQLNATIQRLLIDADGADVLRLSHCADDLVDLAGLPVMPSKLTSDSVTDAIDRAGSVSAAARLLGVDRTTIQRFRKRVQRAD